MYHFLIILFYIGKGKGRRAYVKSGRNNYWQKIVNKHGYRVEIFKENMTEQEALKEEMELIKKYKKSLSLVNFTDGGEGTSGLKMSKETRKKMSAQKKGNIWCQDRKVYTFVNAETNETFKGNRLELSEKENIDIRGIGMMVRGKIKSFKKWVLYGTDYKSIREKERNKHVYKFVNENAKLCYIGTQKQFRDNFNLNHSGVSAICRGERQTMSGWKCVVPKKQNTLNDAQKKNLSNLLKGKNNPSYNNEKILFIRVLDGKEEYQTRCYMRDKYGMTSHISSLISGKIKTHKGWRLG